MALNTQNISDNTATKITGVLEQLELVYDNEEYDLYILSDSGTGDLSIITN